MGLLNIWNSTFSEIAVAKTATITKPAVNWEKRIYPNIEENRYVLYVGNLYVGKVYDSFLEPGFRAGCWVAVIMLDEEGEFFGTYNTAEEAQDALEKAVIENLNIQDNR